MNQTIIKSPDISRHNDVGKPHFSDFRKRFEQKLIFPPKLGRVADEDLQDDRQTSAPVRTSGFLVSSSGGNYSERIVLGGDASDDPVVKLVEVFVVAGAQFGLEVNAFTDSERRINSIENWGNLRNLRNLRNYSRNDSLTKTKKSREERLLKKE